MVSAEFQKNVAIENYNDLQRNKINWKTKEPIVLKLPEMKST